MKPTATNAFELLQILHIKTHNRTIMGSSDRKERGTAKRTKRAVALSLAPTGKYLLIGILGVWGGLLYFAHSTLGFLADEAEGLPFLDHMPSKSAPGQQRQKDVRSHQGGNDTTYHENPWYGWQPKIAPTMECSWRMCLSKKDKCRTCRDSPEDIEPAPPSPSEDWIPDVTMLRRMLLEGQDSNGNPWPPPLDEELCEPMGPFGEKHDQNKQLLEAGPITALPMLMGEVIDKSPKILCLVYTMAENHATNIRAIRETWGSGCDGFLAVSTESDPRIPAISIPHDGPEAYGNMWQKVRSTWDFVGRNYLEDFDFFFIGGEDLFVLPQNLRAYLKTLGSPEDLLFVGRRFKGYGKKNNYFNSGGAGYAMSRGTLRKFYNQGLVHPKCHIKEQTSMEDVMVAECLREVFGIGLTDTRDEQKRERFHPFSPGTHFSWQPPATGKHDWYADYNQEWGLLLGKDCCAPDSVSFHYIKKPTMVRHLQALLYQCNKQ